MNATTFHCAFSERLALLDSRAWDELTVHADVFLKRPFLEALERAAPSNLAPRYALISRNDQPVAALAMQLVLVEGKAALARSVPFSGMAQMVHERALVLGSLAGWGQTGLALAPGVKASEVWPDIARTLDDVRRFEKSRGTVNVTVLKDVGPLPVHAALRSAGYERAPAGADMQLALHEWSSFKDYLSALNAKSRNAVNRTLRDIEAAGYVCRSLSAAEVAANEARLDGLYGQVWLNADVRPIRLSGRFFTELKTRLGDECDIAVLEKDGQVDGFGVTLKNHASSVGYYLGFDRSVKAPLYLRLLLSMVDTSIRWRVARVSLGRTAEEPKARMGAIPSSALIWVKHRTPPMNWAVGAVLSGIEAPSAPTHRVFKVPAAPVLSAVQARSS